MKEFMAEIEYSKSLIEKAQTILVEMVEKNLTVMPFGAPFNAFSVVIGETDKQKIAVIDIPDNLKPTVEQAFIVTE